MSNKLPVKIIAICILSVLIGALFTISGAIGFLFSGIISLASIYSLFLLATGLAFIAAAYGLFTQNEWGRSLAVLAYALSIPLTIFSIISNGGLKQLFSILIAVAIIWYLIKPEVKSSFSKSFSE